MMKLVTVKSIERVLSERGISDDTLLTQLSKETAYRDENLSEKQIRSRVSSALRDTVMTPIMKNLEERRRVNGEKKAKAK